MNDLAEDIRLRMKMKGITLDLRADGVNQELVLDLMTQCLETVKERIKEGVASE